jgi:hypothetical protein
MALRLFPARIQAAASGSPTGSGQAGNNLPQARGCERSHGPTASSMRACSKLPQARGRARVHGPTARSMHAFNVPPHAKLMTLSLEPHPHTCNGSGSAASARRPKKSALTHFPVYSMMLLHAHSHCRPCSIPSQAPSLYPVQLTPMSRWATPLPAHHDARSTHPRCVLLRRRERAPL